MTQKELVLKHLLEGNRISQRKAISYYNIIRLSAVIFDLRNEGHVIVTEYKPNYHNNASHAVYYMIKKKKRPVSFDVIKEIINQLNG